MACHFPLRGYRAKRMSPKGKYPLVFSPHLGNSDQPLDVPCGQCIGCRLERSRQWAIRCTHELSLHKQNAFLTLTYDPSKLPEHGSLVKKHLQDFFKRYRRWLGSHKIKYLACGEYGEKLSRPHYHAIVFGHDFHDKKIFKQTNGLQLFTSDKLEERWTHGFCTIGEANFQTAAYVARYVTKKKFGKQAEEFYGEIINTETGEVRPRRIPEFIAPSQNLAKAWFEKYHKEVYPLDEVLINGRLMKPPKFYDKLHDALDDCAHAEIKAARTLAAKQNPDNTYERRSVLAQIAAKNLNELKRNYEK